MTNTAGPIQHAERNPLIDSLRGFALLGVLMANLSEIVTFAPPEETTKQLVNTPADQITSVLLSLFIGGKFITLFSLLFGYGFGVIIQRIAIKGIPVTAFFMRRMAILLFIGLLHICFWFGDIVSTYALCGMLLLFFRKTSNKGLLIWGAGLLFIAGPLIEGFKIYLLPENTAYKDKLFTAYLQAISSTNFFAIAEYNYKMADFLFIEQWTQFRDMAEVLGKFLFGYYILRTNILSEKNLDTRLLKKIRLYAMIVAAIYLVQKAALGQLSNKAAQLTQYAFEGVGILALSVVYALTIALFFQQGKYRFMLTAFQQTGKMSLTNYLTHTIFFVLIYYGIGLSLMGKLHLQWIIPISLAIYVLQVLFSTLWMKRMRYGPVEWIWRQASYGQRLRLKK